MRNDRLVVHGAAAMVLVLCTVSAQSAELCKWVDENGTVHYATECPESVEGDSVSVEDKAPASAADDPYAEAVARMQSEESASSAPAQRMATQDFSRMSASQLKRECENQRQRLLGPERKQMIEQCVARGEGSAAHCERYYADWGNGGHRGGHLVPRRYDDLPVCVAAREKGG